MKIFDYSALSHREWDREVINYIGTIHEFKGRQDFFLSGNVAKLDKLVEIAKIQSTEASNAIEGIVTTRSRFTQLMAGKTTPRNRDEKEIKGYRYVLDIIHENFEYIPFSPNYILQLHKNLFQFSDVGFGGRFKDRQNQIVTVYPDGTREVIFSPLDVAMAPEAVEKICREYDKATHEGGIDPLIAIPVFIHDFLCIHPFNDGNGRLSRLLTTLLLYRAGYSVGKFISLEQKIQATKDDYYDSLRASSRAWGENANNELPFVKYLLGVILSAYRDFEERVNMLGGKVSALETVERAVASRLGKFTKGDIMAHCPEVSRASVENSLKQMCEKGQLKREGKGKATYYFVP